MRNAPAKAAATRGGLGPFEAGTPARDHAPGVSTTMPHHLPDPPSTPVPAAAKTYRPRLIPSALISWRDRLTRLLRAAAHRLLLEPSRRRRRDRRAEALLARQRRFLSGLEVPRNLARAARSQRAAARLGHPVARFEISAGQVDTDLIFQAAARGHQAAILHLLRQESTPGFRLKIVAPKASAESAMELILGELHANRITRAKQLLELCRRNLPALQTHALRLFLRLVKNPDPARPYETQVLERLLRCEWHQNELDLPDRPRLERLMRQQHAAMPALHGHLLCGLAIYLLNAPGHRRTHLSALPLLQEAAAKHHPGAHLLLALCYSRGVDTGRSAPLADKHLRAFAETHPILGVTLMDEPGVQALLARHPDLPATARAEFEHHPSVATAVALALLHAARGDTRDACTWANVAAPFDARARHIRQRTETALTRDELRLSQETATRVNRRLLRTPTR